MCDALPIGLAFTFVPRPNSIAMIMAVIGASKMTTLWFGRAAERRSWCLVWFEC